MESFDFASRKNGIVSRSDHYGSCALEHFVETRDVHLFKDALQERVLDGDVLHVLGLEILAELVVEFDGNLLVIEKIDRGGSFKSLDDRINFLLFFNYSFHRLSPIA